MHEAHRLGLVHRDIKPENILVERGEDGTGSRTSWTSAWRARWRSGADADGRRARDARVHVARAGARGGARAGSAHRRLLAGRHALRRDRRAAALRLGRAPGSCCMMVAYEEAPPLGGGEEGRAQGPRDHRHEVPGARARPAATTRRGRSRRICGASSTASPSRRGGPRWGTCLWKKARKHKLLAVAAGGARCWARSRLGAVWVRAGGTPRSRRGWRGSSARA